MPDDQSATSSVLSPLAQHLTAAIAGVTRLEKEYEWEAAQRRESNLVIDDLRQEAIELRARVATYEHTIGELRAEVERLKAAASGGQQPEKPIDPKPVDPKPTPAEDLPNIRVRVAEVSSPSVYIDFSTLEHPFQRWKSERRWVAASPVAALSGCVLLIDVHDSGQYRVTLERCDAKLQHTTPPITVLLTVITDRVKVHESAIRIHHHTRPPLVFGPRIQPTDKNGFMQFRGVPPTNRGLLPDYERGMVPETELARIASGGGNWPKWSTELAKTKAAYDPVSEEYGQCVRAWVGGAGPMLNEAGMLMPVQCAYLLSRDERAWREVIRLADSSGNYAVHYRLPDGRFPRADETGSLPILNREEHVALTTAAGVKLPIPDVAHQHSLVYLAYLLTGERYYYEELCSWWAWNLLTRPKNADRLQGIIWSGQVRAAAWALRSLLHLVLASEKGSNEHVVYQTYLLNNLKWMAQQFTRPDSPNYRPTGIPQLEPWRPSGMLQYVRAEPKPQWFATWQLHVMTFVLHECVRAGYDEAIPMRDHLLKVAEACWRYSPTKYLAPWGNHAIPAGILAAPAGPSSDWSHIMGTTFQGMPASDPHRTAFLDPITPDYIVWFRAACVVGVDAGQGQAWAKEALTWIDAEVPKSRWKALPYEWRVQPGATS